MRRGAAAFLYGGLGALAGFLVALGLGWGGRGAILVVALALLAVYFQRHPKLNIIAFTFWVLTATCWALWYPSHFLSWGGFELSRLSTPLIQIIMLGMGTTLSLHDFARALRMPRAVLAGMALQFTVMPLLGWAIAVSFGFPDAIAAGVILIGSCSGGVASNVMAFLSKGNVALSVSMTACSTLMAPLMTPLAMRLLAGQFIEIDFLAMMQAIFELVVLPVGAGLILNRLLAGRRVVLDRLLPGVAMAAICFILAIIAAGARDHLLQSGLALLAAALLHNVSGYVLGYAAARLLQLRETDSRTVAFEVGMQNGGMAVGLAATVLKSAAAGLAPAIFGTLMNVTGSALASWWRDRPPSEER